MWHRINLRLRIFIVLASLVFITLGGGLVMIWYTYSIENLFSDIIAQHLEAFQAAEALETALINQKGLVTYYFQDSNPDWLKQLGEYRQVFRERLENARALARNEQERATIDRIDHDYRQYVALKDRVIELYRSGKRDLGLKMHQEVRHYLFGILALTEAYKNFHKENLARLQAKSLDQAFNLRIIAASAGLVVIVLGLVLAFLLVSQILEPIRRLAREVDAQKTSGRAEDEVKAISRSVHWLMQDRDQTQTELEKSRENLVQAEKLAIVGKLAAGVAHSIRNPLTSVKMRLFSLGRTLNLTPTQKEDFHVIAEEIRNIDTIVQNFLEFSRPPKLRKQKLSPSEIVDLVLQLLKHRLESYEVEVKVNRGHRLPLIQIDPEQLKEALVNILVNACEAMGSGGKITIDEREGHLDGQGQGAVISITDNGPGVPPEIRDRIFEPFFTAKDDGSGLGLSIAARIIAEHGGRLDLISQEGQGASFLIYLPTRSEP